MDEKRIHSDIFAEIRECQLRRIPAALVTITKVKGSAPRHAGAKMVVRVDGSFSGTIGGALLEKQAIDAAVEAVRVKEPRLITLQLFEKDDGSGIGVCGGEAEIFIDPIVIPNRVIIFGGGHVAKPTAHIAAMCGFAVSIYDERAEWAAAERFPEAEIVRAGSYDEAVEKLNIEEGDYVVIVSPSHEIDYRVLRMVIDRKMKYLGVICSRRKWKLFREKLEQEGVDSSDIDKVHAPIGIDIGSETPEEIAVSITGELIKVRRLEV